VWDDPHLFKIDVDNLLRRCVSLDEAKRTIWQCHNSTYGGHFNWEKTVRIVGLKQEGGELFMKDFRKL